MKDKLIVKKTLGSVSSVLINELKNRGKTVFTLAEASEIYGRGKYETTKFLGDLIKRRILARIKSGIYLILEMGQENTLLNNWPLIAHQLAGNETYCLSHYSAMRLHGMTTHASMDVFVTLSCRCSNKKIGYMFYHFIYCHPKDLWGFGAQWITKQDKVYVSDIEKTLLDSLERPDLCGGIKEIVRGIWVKQNEIDWIMLTQYAEKFRTKASVKRLGFILERLDLGANFLPLLEKIIASSKDYIFLDPNGEKKGRYISRWRIRLNMNIEELKASIWG